MGAAFASALPFHRPLDLRVRQKDVAEAFLPSEKASRIEMRGGCSLSGLGELLHIRRQIL